MRPVLDKNKTSIATDYGVIPFDHANMRPLDHTSRTMQALYQKALDENSMTEPDPYVEPPPSADQVRQETFASDADRADLLDKLREATPAQIKAYVQNNVTDLASARVMMMKILLLLATAIRQ